MANSECSPVIRLDEVWIASYPCGRNRQPLAPPSVRSSDIYFDFWHGSGDLGDSTEYEDDSDEEDDPVSYLLL